ncbi:MAG: nucleotide exchange factor GrpE [Clostridia bacterium]|nr:nucleotide exchange factor GrpE [Clostridia bacterium]
MTEETKVPNAEAEAKETDKKSKKSSALKEENERLRAELEEQKKMLAEQNDKYLRMAAEYDNFRRRSREEKEATYENALSDTVAELLPIIDNLERAAMYDDGEKVRDGLVMIAKSVTGALSALGVEEIGKVGDTFDPNLHSAVMHVEDESLGEGEIVEVFQKGYKKGKHIIRFATVKTAN